MYIFVKRVWFIMFIYLLVIADKKISHIMCILTILTDLWTIKQNNEKHFCKHCLQCFNSENKW